MAAAQDLYLQLKISEFCERCCVWKISDRHLRTTISTQQIYWCPAEISMYALVRQGLCNIVIAIFGGEAAGETVIVCTSTSHTSAQHTNEVISCL